MGRRGEGASLSGFHPSAKRDLPARQARAVPASGEVKHDRPWLMKEFDLVSPDVVVALGATAVLVLAGKQIRSSAPAAERSSAPTAAISRSIPPFCSALPDVETKRRGYEEFLTDLARTRDLARADRRGLAGGGIGVAHQSRTGGAASALVRRQSLNHPLNRHI